MAGRRNQPVEARIEIDGLDVTAVTNQHSADIDHLLELRGAESFVFIPLARLGKKGQRLYGCSASRPPSPARRQSYRRPIGTTANCETSKTAVPYLAYLHSIFDGAPPARLPRRWAA
jgi:hypothetical protein